MFMNHVLLKNAKIPIVLICLLLGFAQLTIAQNQQVKGKVTDDAGEAIVGANVAQKGAVGIGTITDSNGDFTLRVPGNATLVISYLGYVTKEIKVNNQANILVRMSEDTQALDELVVTGYTSQKKLTVTGSLSSVSNKQLTVTKNENVINMLSGKMPGLRITQRSAQPGAYNAIIDIRGMGEEIKPNGEVNRTDPLFVIDGISRDKDYFARMDPNEIESITILKDASAAIYGLRSANGVILVTTKSGTAQNGKVDITYSGSYTLQQMIYIPKGISTYDWMTLRNEQVRLQFLNNYLNPQPLRHSLDEMKPWLDGTKQGYDWVGTVFRNNSPQTEHNLSVDGGTEKLRFFVNLGFSRQDGAYASGDLWSDKWNFRSNLDAKITNRLSARISIGAILGQTHEPGTGLWSVYKDVWLTRPDAPFYANDNPDYMNGDNNYVNDGNNQLAATNSDYSGYRLNKTRRMNGTGMLSYEIPGIKGLTAQASYDYAMSIPDNTNYQQKYYLYVFSAPDTYTPTLRNQPSRINRWASFNYDTDLQLKLLYRNKFGLHSVNGLLAFQESYSNWEDFQAQRDLSVNSKYLFAGETDNQQASGGYPGDRLNQAFIGQFNYDYNGKYLIDLRFRYDGSSRYPIGSRWGFFPSVSLGWRLSEEKFLKNNLTFLTNLKVRASYGEMGDDAAANNYPPIYVGYNIDKKRGWVFGSSLVSGFTATAIPNPNLTWYDIKMYNLGLDFDVLNQKLSGTFEVFRRDRTGLLATSSAIVPGTVGAEMPQENLNADRDFGWEIELSHHSRIEQVDYFVSGQFSATRRMLTKWLESPASNSFDNWKYRNSGRYTNIWWGREAGSMFTNINDILNYQVYPMPQGSTPGDWSFVDWNGDGIINEMDDHPLATKGMPFMSFGLSIGASYKNFDLSANFQGSYKVYTQLSEVFVEALPFGGRNTLSWFMDRWHPTDPNADFYNPNTQWIAGYYPATGHDARRVGTNGVMDASYMRLKTLELGYTIPGKLTNKAGIKNLRLYVNGYNLLTFSKLKGIDPERPSSTRGFGATSSDVGYADMYAYPNNRTFTIGASIKF